MEQHLRNGLRQKIAIIPLSNNNNNNNINNNNNNTYYYHYYYYYTSYNYNIYITINTNNFKKTYLILRPIIEMTIYYKAIACNKINGCLEEQSQITELLCPLGNSILKFSINRNLRVCLL